MEVFGNLDDELFLHSQKKRQVCHSNYRPKKCEELWFLAQEDKNNLEVVKFRADYYYIEKDYGRAADEYLKCLHDCGPCNATIRRDCLECLTHSLMHLGSEDSVTHAKTLHSESCNIDQKLCSSKLLATVYHMQMRYKDELEVLQFCVAHHPSNADFWVRLAICYACANGIPFDPLCGEIVQCSKKRFCPELHRFDSGCWCLGCSCSSLSSRSEGHNAEKQKATRIACACLIRAEMMFRESRSGHRSFARVRNEAACSKIMNAVWKTGVGEEFVKTVVESFNNKRLEENEENSQVMKTHDCCSFEEYWFPFL